MKPTPTNDLLSRLIALEADVRYREPARDGESEIGYAPGRVPVLLSAPHAAIHTRLRQPKEEDEFTGGLARLVAERTGAHALYARRRSDTDPNWYRDVPYKRRLAAIVAQAGIRFVLDLHAASPHRDFGVALGTLRGRSCPPGGPVAGAATARTTGAATRADIVATFEGAGFGREAQGVDRLDVDRTFTACGLDGQETVTRYVWERLGVPAAQIELHTCLRVAERRPDATSTQPYRGDPQRIARVVRALVDLVRSGMLYPSAE
jgi:hypothetical protein